MTHNPPPMKTVPVRIPVPMWRRAQVVASYRGVSFAVVMRDALAAYLDHQLGAEARKELYDPPED